MGLIEVESLGIKMLCKGMMSGFWVLFVLGTVCSCSCSCHGQHLLAPMGAVVLTVCQPCNTMGNITFNNLPYSWILIYNCSVVWGVLVSKLLAHKPPAQVLGGISYTSAIS